MKKYLYIALGAMVGALLRFGLSLLTATMALPFFYGTLLVNLIGAFAAGFLVRRFEDRDGAMKAFLIPGLLGSFTTFSMLTYEQYLLLSVGEYVTFIVYFALNILSGFCLALLGFKAGGIRR